MSTDTQSSTTRAEAGNTGGTYDHSAVERRWQRFWQEYGTFRADDAATSLPKYYILDMFPYPSAAGLHIGHPEGYTASDILARYKKARGFNVLHPMGWDAFGLPAEQYAIQTGQAPSVQTAQNIANFRRQLKMLGFAVDWSREVNTTDPVYFKWTQWIFLQLFKHGLAYVDEKPVWFCPALGTVLANEEVLNTSDGPRSERGAHPVERRPIRQWVLRITAYAEKLIAGLDALDWPDSTKRLQKNWIGRSEGAEVDFAIADGAAVGEKLTVYTTRPDTLFGATYLVIAPEHPLVAQLTSLACLDAVEAYLAKVRNKTDLERTDLAKDKSGVFSGANAINPVNGTRIPIWIADYVLMGYGTGAIMAVPAHDQRDWDFAKKFKLPIIPVVTLPQGTNVDLDKAAFEADGYLVNSGPYDGLQGYEARQRITADLAARKLGKSAVNYKLQDWLFSRQRYWGEPFPILWVSPENYARIPTASPFREFLPSTPVTCQMEGETWYALPLGTPHLPLELPTIKSYLPAATGESPLARATEWLHVNVNLETGEVSPAGTVTPAATSGPVIPALRETNTMPQWAGSCWYYLRYIDPENTSAMASPEKLAYWGVPDFYIGGAEHAVLHLLYARFWHLFLYDIGVVPTPEPFQRLFHQGIILGEAEYHLVLDENGKPRSATADDARNLKNILRQKLTEDEVEKRGNDWFWKEDLTIRVDAQSQKMSKSLGNVVNPDDIVHVHGTDALRLYLMFLGPLEAAKPWNTKNIEGITRFLRRVWRLVINENTGTLATRIQSNAPAVPALERLLHQTIRKVTEDIEGLRFNTAISQLMIFLNAAEKVTVLDRHIVQDFLRILAPLAPHIAEELWCRLHEDTPANGTSSIVNAGWPVHDPAKLVEDSDTIILQINGKVRAQAVLPRNTSRAALLAAAHADATMKRFIEGREVVREIVIPGKLVNIVIK